MLYIYIYLLMFDDMTSTSSLIPVVVVSGIVGVMEPDLSDIVVWVVLVIGGLEDGKFGWRFWVLWNLK